MKKFLLCSFIGLCLLGLVACIPELPDQTESTTTQVTQKPTQQTTEQSTSQQTTKQTEQQSSESEPETTFGPLHFPEETTN